MGASIDSCIDSLLLCRRPSHALGETAGTELHCDMAGLVVGPKFRGIKMIPPGLHLFCWDAGQDKVGRGWCHGACVRRAQQMQLLPRPNGASPASVLGRAMCDECSRRSTAVVHDLDGAGSDLHTWWQHATFLVFPRAHVETWTWDPVCAPIILMARARDWRTFPWGTGLQHCLLAPPSTLST